jgi:hypothetical protein
MGRSRLQEATIWVNQKQDIAAWLGLADKLMEVYRSERSMFRLSGESEPILPIIEKFAYDAAGFADYILTFRDTLERGSSQYQGVNKLYRSVFTRAIQQERRARADLAVAKCIELYGDPPSFSERLSWIARREADWAGQRLAFLDEMRHRHDAKKLSREETNRYLALFWNTINESIEERGVPPWLQ